MTAQDIYPTLAERLGEDLDEQLPKRTEKQCRGVVFLDTFEDLASGEQNEARRQLMEGPVRELYTSLTCVLLVMFGRDRLTWDKVDPKWGDRAKLDQHPLYGLSLPDATEFLKRCGIEPGPLQEAILHVSRDQAVPEREAYYPFGLGLCADTVLAQRRRNLEPHPDTFDMAPGDYGKLAQRFLKSLHDEHPEPWIIRLAQTPRFDETAARAAFSAMRDVHQDEAWESLPAYSFVQQDAEPGWLRIHSVIRDALRRQLASDKTRFTRAHTDWQTHWHSRAQHDADEFAALAWYHDYVRDPQQALSAWYKKAEKARADLNMALHLALIDWWAPTEIVQRTPKTPDEAAALNWLGVEMCQATLGNRTLNLRREIACHEAALRVFTESDLPKRWAATQNNLGLAYWNLPTGDRDANLRDAIACYEAALRVFTESHFPPEWATTQDYLGLAYGDLPTGDRDANLRHAIACFEAALRVRTESDFPREWATTQNNLGAAYWSLRTGDRDANLRLAITCYEAALRVFTESDFPREWATTKNNLGAYGDLPTGDRDANLRHAIACFEAALRVFTESDFPRDWATTKNNLGLAYWNLPTGDRDANLRHAIACYEAALRVFTESDFPWEWAGTQFNLGLALRDDGRLDESARRSSRRHRVMIAWAMPSEQTKRKAKPRSPGV